VNREWDITAWGRNPDKSSFITHLELMTFIFGILRSLSNKWHVGASALVLLGHSSYPQPTGMEGRVSREQGMRVGGIPSISSK
jgi:hypothetical protein